jgi:hypothetical protein
MPCATGTGSAHSSQMEVGSHVELTRSRSGKMALPNSLINQQ